MRDEEIYKEAGQRIQNLRKQWKLTREELAEFVGLSMKHIYEIETGRKGFSASTLYRIAIALGVGCDDIMMGKEQHVVECIEIHGKIVKNHTRRRNDV